MFAWSGVVGVEMDRKQMGYLLEGHPTLPDGLCIGNEAEKDLRMTLKIFRLRNGWIIVKWRIL